MAELAIPALALVVLVGPSGSGKTTFARRAFKPTEVLSSDAFRGMVRDDETSLEATNDAFEILHSVARKRLAAGLLTVVDATNVQPDARRPLLALAREFHAMPVAIALDLPLAVCVERNRARPDRPDSERYVRQQHLAMRRCLGGRGGRGLEHEGFRYVHVLGTAEAAAEATIVRSPMWSDRRADCGPFDLIGDVHGCADELEALLGRLGYASDPACGFRHGDGRRAIFLGDLVDRGPRNLDALRIAMRMVAGGTALAVPGNHDIKFLRWLNGRQVTVAHGLALTIAEVEALPGPEQAAFRAEAARFLDGLVSHLVLDRGRLVVAHAGMKAGMQGRASGAVRQFALYGETTGEIDDYGLPVRCDWAASYRGEASVVYGHTPVPRAEWVNRTLCIDTGCVFGGRLTALRWPERTLVDVPAARMHCPPARPFLPDPPGAPSAQQQVDRTLDLADITGKRTVHTRLVPAITVGAEASAAAVEALSRFAADPRWLIYLPPTMSPPATSRREGLLEHPDEAFAYYRDHGVAEVVCEEKHMGSRAVLIIARDAAAARHRFGIEDGSDGIVLSRTGRPFFDDPATAAAVLARVRAAIAAAGWWERFATEWVCLDAELMPWSAKAVELLRRQYAAVGAAGRMAMGVAARDAAAAVARGVDAGGLDRRLAEHAANLDAFTAAYRRYCWPVAGIGDLRLAPFHLLAAEGAVFADRDHAWHMATLAELAAHDPGWLLATPWRRVALADPGAVAEATAWWDSLTAGGGEGMVVKPLAFIAHDAKGPLQPAVKCRGREYLRIIYGPNYTRPEHLDRLRRRGLAGKRSLALREFALGIEALEAFVRGESLRKVHSSIAAILALESDPVDPRL